MISLRVTALPEIKTSICTENKCLLYKAKNVRQIAISLDFSTRFSKGFLYSDEMLTFRCWRSGGSCVRLATGGARSPTFFALVKWQGWPRTRFLRCIRGKWPRTRLRDNLAENGAAIRIRAGGREIRNNCADPWPVQAFFRMPTFGCRASIATGQGNPQVLPCPVFPDCDRSRAAARHVVMCHSRPIAAFRVATKCTAFRSPRRR